MNAAALREALAYFDDTRSMPPEVVYDHRQIVLMDAARERLAQLDNHALVIERDGDGWSDWVVRAFEAAGFTVHETISALAALAGAQQRGSE